MSWDDSVPMVWKSPTAATLPWLVSGDDGAIGRHPTWVDAVHAATGVRPGPVGCEPADEPNDPPRVQLELAAGVAEWYREHRDALGDVEEEAFDRVITLLYGE